MSDADQDLAARLTEAARAVTDSLSADEVAAIRRYQALDRSYELVNRFLRGDIQPQDLSAVEAATVRDVVRGLTSLLRRWRVPEPIVVYRGLRSRSGVDLSDSPLVARSFLSTTIFRDVAINEFTVPPGLGGPVLLEISLPAGTPAVWVPSIGEPTLAYQGALLLARGARLAVRTSLDQDGILVVDCEVPT